MSVIFRASFCKNNFKKYITFTVLVNLKEFERISKLINSFLKIINQRVFLFKKKNQQSWIRRQKAQTLLSIYAIGTMLTALSLLFNFQNNIR